MVHRSGQWAPGPGFLVGSIGERGEGRGERGGGEGWWVTASSTGIQPYRESVRGFAILYSIV